MNRKKASQDDISTDVDAEVVKMICNDGTEALVKTTSRRRSERFVYLRNLTRRTNDFKPFQKL